MDVSAGTRKRVLVGLTSQGALQDLLTGVTVK
jgi:hypothetical protein